MQLTNSTPSIAFDRLLCYDPEQRISANDALMHPYFAESPAPQDPKLMPTFPSRESSEYVDGLESDVMMVVVVVINVMEEVGLTRSVTLFALPASESDRNWALTMSQKQSDVKVYSQIRTQQHIALSRCASSSSRRRLVVSCLWIQSDTRPRKLCACIL
jgi:serine/threonine protein kinase